MFVWEGLFRKSPCRKTSAIEKYFLWDSKQRGSFRQSTFGKISAIENICSGIQGRGALSENQLFFRLENLTHLTVGRGKGSPFAK